MNKEIRRLFDEKNIITKKITIKKNARIIDTGDMKFVIKKRNKDVDDIFKYLESRSFTYFPKIIYKTKNYDIYEYIDSVDISPEEKGVDIIKVVTMLHNKTTYHKEVDEDYYKELYEKFHDNIDYLNNYYNDIATIIEKEDYMSPSNYLFIRNISKVFQALNYCKNNINKWYDIINEKKRIRVVNIHNNLSLDHYLLSDKPYLISWEYSKKDMPIYDLIKLYKKYYLELDFCDLLRNYEMNYPLLLEEKILFFCLISVPDKIDFNDTEYNMCIKVKKFYDYINVSEKFMSDYFPNNTDNKDK
jgi:hypothetical protein